VLEGTRGGRGEVAGCNVARRSDSAAGRRCAGEHSADDWILARRRGRDCAPAPHADGVGAVADRVAGQGGGWTWRAASGAFEGGYRDGPLGCWGRSASRSAEGAAFGKASHVGGFFNASGVIRNHGCAFGRRAGTSLRSGESFGARFW